MLYTSHSSNTEWAPGTYMDVHIFQGLLNKSIYINKSMYYCILPHLSRPAEQDGYHPGQARPLSQWMEAYKWSLWICRLLGFSKHLENAPNLQAHCQ